MKVNIPVPWILWEGSLTRDFQDILRRRLAELWKVVHNNEVRGVLSLGFPRVFCVENGNRTYVV